MTAAVKDLLALVEETAPAALAESWDNVGLLVGDRDAAVRKVWLALEVTEPVIEAAAAANVDVILTHHPLIFSAMKRVTAQDATGRMVLSLAKAGISVVSAHTNLDAAQGGVNDCLAAKLELTEIGLLPDFSCGRTGLLPAPMTAEETLGWIEKKLDPSVLRATVLPQGKLHRVALCSGAGGDAMEAAKAWGADFLLVGEAKYHEALEAAQMGLFLVEAGHDSTENVVLEPWMRHLQMLADGLKLEIEFFLAPLATSPYARLRR